MAAVMNERPGTGAGPAYFETSFWILLMTLADPGDFVPERHRQAGRAWPEVTGGRNLPNADALNVSRR